MKKISEAQAAKKKEAAAKLNQTQEPEPEPEPQQAEESVDEIDESEEEEEIVTIAEKETKKTEDSLLSDLLSIGDDDLKSFLPELQTNEIAPSLEPKTGTKRKLSDREDDIAVVENALKRPKSKDVILLD